MPTSARADDQALPFPIVDVHPDCDTYGLHLAAEAAFDVLTGLVVWDGPAWDDPVNTWGGAATWVDVAGDVEGFQLTAGRHDPSLGDMEAALLTVTLDNRSGRYSQFHTAPDGSIEPTFFLPGRQVVLWYEVDDAAMPDGRAVVPRFWGRIERWDENLVTVDGDPPTIEVTAVDGFALLRASIDGLEYRLGGEGDVPLSRISNLLDIGQWAAPRRLDRGDVTLASRLSVNPILEELHAVARSDGGVCFVDTEGTFRYLDRYYLGGRLDQEAPLPFSDDCSPGTFTFSAGDPLVDTFDVVNSVVLQNQDGVVARAEDAASLAKYGRRQLPRSSDRQWWRTVAEGEALGQWYVANRADLYWRYDEIALVAKYGEPSFRFFADVRIGDEIVVTRTMVDGGLLTTRMVVEGFEWRAVARGAYAEARVFVSKGGA